MAERNFIDLLHAQWNQNKFVCVGLDSEMTQLPRFGALAGLSGEEARLAFNKAIIDATVDVASVYKPNSAFYEAQGGPGIETLRATIAYIRKCAPRIPVILDAKRGDIGSTNEGYATYAFEYLQADAITVQPYLGKEALLPLLERKDKGVIVLARTSNPGAGEFQDLEIDGQPLYARVAQQVAEQWNENGNCGLVAGATYPDELAAIRKLAGDLPLLIPGVGAQGGEAATLAVGRDSNGQGMIINSSRGIIFASSGEDFALAAGKAAEALHVEITAALMGA